MSCSARMAPTKGMSMSKAPGSEIEPAWPTFLGACVSGLYTQGVIQTGCLITAKETGGNRERKVTARGWEDRKWGGVRWGGVGGGAKRTNRL